MFAVNSVPSKLSWECTFGKDQIRDYRQLDSQSSQRRWLDGVVLAVLWAGYSVVLFVCPFFLFLFCHSEGFNPPQSLCQRRFCRRLPLSTGLKLFVLRRNRPYHILVSPNGPNLESWSQLMLMAFSTFQF
jgi:hypothetical protein